MGDTGQLTFKTMGGDTVTVKARGKHYVEPRGYAQPPGTGPAGEKCRTCKHYAPSMLRSGKSYPKCALFTKPTHGRGSDILANAPACRLWATRTGNG